MASSDNKININVNHSSDVSFGDISINNNLPMPGEEQAELLEKISDLVKSEGDKQSAEIFAAFKEEIEKPKPRKSILQSLWSGLTLALPAVSQSVDIAGKILKLIS